METNEEEDVIPAAQGPPKEKLLTLLEHKAHLRHVLLRAKHYRVFLEECRTKSTIPKGPYNSVEKSTSCAATKPPKLPTRLKICCPKERKTYKISLLAIIITLLLILPLQYRQQRRKYGLG